MTEEVTPIIIENYEKLYRHIILQFRSYRVIYTSKNSRWLFLSLAARNRDH